MTITSVGFGDICATFNNPVEMWICSFIMLISSLLWAQVIGTFCGVIATFNPEANAFQAKMDELNRFMKRENVPHEMRQRLREYFHQSKHLRLAQTQNALLDDMSPSLMREVTWGVNKEWLTQVWFLRDAPRQFMIEMARTLQARVFSPGDAPALGFMYIVHRGLALYQAKVVTKGQVIGSDIILASPQLRSTAQARAMNYLEVFFTSRKVLMRMASRYPDTAKQIRRAAVFLALRRKMIEVAKQALGIKSVDMIAKAISIHNLMNNDAAGNMMPDLMSYVKVASPAAPRRPGQPAVPTAYSPPPLEASTESDFGDDDNEQPFRDVAKSQMPEDEGGWLGGWLGGVAGDESAEGNGRDASRDQTQGQRAHALHQSPGVIDDARMTKLMSMMESTLRGQTVLKKELSKQREEYLEMANDMRSLRTWIINDKFAIAKLQA